MQRIQCKWIHWSMTARAKDRWLRSVTSRHWSLRQIYSPRSIESCSSRQEWATLALTTTLLTSACHRSTQNNKQSISSHSRHSCKLTIRHRKIQAAVVVPVKKWSLSAQIAWRKKKADCCMWLQTPYSRFSRSKKYPQIVLAAIQIQTRAREKTQTRKMHQQLYRTIERISLIIAAYKKF